MSRTADCSTGFRLQSASPRSCSVCVKVVLMHRVDAAGLHAPRDMVPVACRVPPQLFVCVNVVPEQTVFLAGWWAPGVMLPVPVLVSEAFVEQVWVND